MTAVELKFCSAHSKELVVINCNLSAQSIKENLGEGQGRVYIRPIQKSLSTTPFQPEDNNSSIKEECILCKGQFFLGELRRHVETCRQQQDTDSSASSVSDQEEADGVSDGDCVTTVASNVAETGDDTAKVNDDTNSNNENRRRWWYRRIDI